ncbi:MAG: TetR/AcrR family transcriptional regulator [Chloroflexi bacterium]|nr:TetR/AcrR family transcriptional regulator [Chloroflexota bacterium]
MPQDSAAQSEQEQVRDRILTAASQLFVDKGFPNVSVREICEAAETSLPMLYYYFDSKEGLFRMVVQEKLTMRTFLEYMRSEIGEISNSSLRLRRFIHNYLHHYPKDLASMGYYMRDSTSMEKESVKRFISAQNELKEIASSLLRTGRDDGIWRETDAGMAADCLIGMLNTFVFRDAHFGVQYHPAQVGDYIYDFFSRAIRNDASPA